MPGLQVLRSYQAKNLAPDILAGLVICLVLIPSALAYAELAGLKPSVPRGKDLLTDI
jgi:MFS superfamily sulfate permease-like transporter